MRAVFPKKCVIKTNWPNSVVIFINNGTFARRAHVGKIIYGVCPTLGMSFQSFKWLVPGMVGMGGVVVRKRAV